MNGPRTQGWVPFRSRLRVLVNLDRAPGLICGVADIFQKAIDALGFAGDAELASVPDDLVGE